MISELSGNIQLALEAGVFERALPLFERFGKAVTMVVHANSDIAQQRRMIDDAAAFLRDRLHLARVMRARLASEAASLTQSMSYTGAQPVEAIWQMEA